MKLQDFRDKIPQLSGLDDESALNVLQKTYYPNVDRARMAEAMGIKPAAATVEPRGALRAVGDTAVQFGKGAVSGVRMMSDVFGADNAVSGGLRSADEALSGLLSATAKQDQAQVAAIMEEAEGKGWMDQIGIGLKAAGVSPGALLAQAAGTALPTIAASALTGGAAPASMIARLGMAGAMGGAQGVGATKGAIYDNTKQQLLKAGASPEEAEARAVAQQSYGGDSSGQIALGGGLGVLAGSTGAEKLVAGLRGGVTQAAPGIMRRMASGGVVEAVPEFLQGGQEKYATNSALNNEGFQVDPMSGVVANATMEGVAGAGVGAGFGILSPVHVPDVGPLSRAANAGIDAAGPVVVPPAPAPLAPEQEQTLLDHANTRAREIAQKANGTKDEKVPGPDGKPITIPGLQPEFLTPAEKEEQAFLAENGGDAQALAQAYPGLSAAPKVEHVPAEQQPQAATTPPASAAELPQPTAEAFAQREQDRPADPVGEPLDGDILNNLGKPFKTMPGAMTAMNKAGEGHEIVRVATGLVVRKKASNGTTDATPSSAANSAPVQPTDTAASVGTGPGLDTGPAADQARPDPVDLGATGGLPGGSVDGAVNVQNPQAPAIPAPTQAPGAPAQAVAGNAAPAAGLPAAGTGALEGAGVAELTIDDINSGKAFVDNTKAKIKEWVSKATNNGAREIDRNWERGAVKRFIDSNIKAMLDGKQTGNRAAAKIAVGKAQTFDDLSTAIEKFANNTPTASDTSAPSGVTSTPQSGTSSSAEGESWTRMPQAERQALAGRAIKSKLVADKIARTAWADIVPATQARIVAAMGTVQDPQVTQPAQPGTTGEGAGATQPTQAAPIAPPELSRAAAIDDGPAVVLQNRDRSSAASIAQMNEIAGKPDYLRAGQSSVMDTGAPVVIDTPPPSAVIGRTQTIADGTGKRNDVRYAVVEASDLLASHTADGLAVPEYANGLPGKLRAVAGNGRVAGLVAGYARGTTAQYKQDLIADAPSLALDAQAVAAMKAPVLVRLMDAKDVTPDIADRGNIANVARLSAVEQANTDVRRLDLTDLELMDNGEPTPAAVMKFIRAMPTSEQSGLMETSGVPARQASERLMAAFFKQAYGSDELVALYAQAQDSEAKTIMSALAEVAGLMSKLKGTGEYDIRGAITEAAGFAVNARRAGQKLTDMLKTRDMSMSDEALVVATFMAENIRSGKKIAEGLRNLATDALEQAEILASNESQGGMFGDAPASSRYDVLRKLNGNKDITPQENGLQQPGRAQAPQGVVGRINQANDQQPEEQPAKQPVPEQAPQEVAKPEAPKPQGVSANKIFTEDMAAQARALLKSRLGTLNAGIDPEVLQAGITLAGYHIEKGARTFVAYAKAMINDLGEGIKPYLKSWYLAAKFDPRFADFKDMDSAATVEAASLDDKAAPKPDLQKSTEEGDEVIPAEPHSQGEQDILVAPTRADVLAQQTALEAEAKRKEQGGDKPIERKVTGDTPDMFNTQGSIFDAPVEPEAPQAPKFSRASQKGKSGVLSANGQFKAWPENRNWNRAEYEDVVSLLPDGYRNDSHRREPLPTKEWNLLAAKVAPELEALNDLIDVPGAFLLDSLGNITANHNKAPGDVIINEAKEIADKYNIGMYITNVKIPFMKPMMEKGFTSEIGISMVVQRAARDTIDTGTNWGKAAELNREVDKTPLRLETESIYRQIPGNVMSYKPRGFGQAMFSRATSGATSPEQNALKALSENDELFAMPKSDKDTLEGIAADTDPGITVKKLNHPGLVSTYILTLPNGGRARLMVRKVNQYGPQSYGSNASEDSETNNPILERPGNNAEGVPDDIEDVYIDVSALKEGKDGGKIYNIAATYAHNTGRILIGDPGGLSDIAMRRRTEHMLASALKFGTTQHLAPHPRQVDGAHGIGVPPLRWTYGDDLGNIKSLIQTSLDSLDHAGTQLLTFDLPTGTFRDSAGGVLDERAIRSTVESGRRPAGRAGITTYKRSAVLRSLVREGGKEGRAGEQGAGILAQLVDVGRQFPAASKKIFYSRGANTSGLTAPQVSGIVDAIKARWGNAPDIVVAASMTDPAIPQAVRDYDQTQKSQGATGEPEGFVYRGKVYIVADQMAGANDVMRVLFHESLGHMGLRGVFGERLTPILKQLAALRRADVAAKARQYGLDVNNREDMLTAAEEVLAEMAQTRPEIGYVQRAIAAIRAWLRQNVLGFKAMKLTDSEIINSYLLPARRFIEGQKAPASGTSSTPVVFGRGTNEPMTNKDVVGNPGGRPADDSTPGSFKNSKVVDAKGKLLTVYHGTIKEFDQFDPEAEPYNYEGDRGKQFFLDSAKGAGEYAIGTSEDHGGNPNIRPAHLNIQNPRIEHTDRSPSEWWDDNGDLAWKLDTINKGHDGMIIYGDGETMYVTSSPDQIKSIFDKNESTAPDSGGAMFSRSLGGTLNAAANNVLNERKTKIVGETARQHTPEQLRAMKNVGFQVELPSLKERAQTLWQDAGKKLAQGIVDQFAPIKDIDKDAYGLLRLAKGASGAFEAFMHGGKLKLTDNVYDFDEQNKGGVVDKLLIPLQGEHHDFMRWVAANRAERLSGVGKENLFSPQDIIDLKTLASGDAAFDYTIQNGILKGKVTRDRAKIYRDSLVTFNSFQNNVLDMAEQSGLIDGEARNLWEHEFYVPFYRVEDDGSVAGAHIKNGVVRQQAFKSLTGRVNKLNADLLDNTLMNWAHLLDASAKNRAAKATIEAIEKMGAAIPLEGSAGKGSVWFRENGQKRWALIDDPMLLTAVSALEYAGMRNPAMNAMGTMKRILTVGVTASPFFKIRNLIRDSVQVLGTSKINPNPAINIAQGWKLTDPKSDAYFRLLAGGGTIHFGTMLEGSESKRVQALVESGVSDATILGDEHKVKAFYRKYIEPGITAYNELGNRGEAINRASLYDQLVKGGMSHADASLQARDLMDFSMQGSFTSIRFLTQVVPFFNARIQGLYKLGRAAKEDPARFSAVLGATALFSLALLAAYSDDDDWKKREEWDRNNYWWFKFGGTAFRIPKPFEIGAIATLAERGFELAFDNEMTGERFRKQVMTLLGDNLSMNPVPQLVKPIMDVYANKDSFSGRPIETMGMERLKSEYRFTDRTSMTARGLSTAANSVAGLVGGESLSPVQIDHMLRGYFGWLGTFVVGTADKIARPATGQNERPSSDMWKTLTGGIVSGMRDAPSRYVSQMYEQAREIEQAYGTWRALQKEGRAQEAAEFAQDNQGKLSKYHFIKRIKRQEASANQRIRMIERSEMDSDSKRELIRQIQKQKDQIARRISA